MREVCQRCEARAGGDELVLGDADPDYPQHPAWSLEEQLMTIDDSGGKVDQLAIVDA
jgi:hypothetical protein